MAIQADVTTLDWPWFRRAILNGQGATALLVDPPWSQTKDPKRALQPSRGAPLPYDLLSIEQLASLPLGSLVDNGVIFLWYTACHLENALALLRSWGYRYVD